MGLYSSKDYELKTRIDILEKRLKELECRNKPERKKTSGPHPPRKMPIMLQNDIKKAKLNTCKKEKPPLPILYRDSLFLQLTSEIEKRRQVINVQYTDPINDPDILFNTMDSFI